MNSEADVAVLTAQQKSLLEALPCYVFVQRGSSVVYANRAAREILHLEEGAVARGRRSLQRSVSRLCLMRIRESLTRAPGNVFGSGSQAYSSDFNCQHAYPVDPSVPVRGSFRMLRVEPEPELLIVALRSQRDAEKDAEVRSTVRPRTFWSIY